MTDENKIAKAIAAIIQQTQDGTLEWQAVSPPPIDLTKGTEDIVQNVYLANKEGRLLRLFPFKTKFYRDEDMWVWVDDVALELSDYEHTAWWRFPAHHIVQDLLEAVRFKTVGVDEFIDRMLTDRK